MDQLGIDKVVATMNDLASKNGEKFKPAQSLVDMAAKGERFHP